MERVRAHTAEIAVAALVLAFIAVALQLWPLGKSVGPLGQGVGSSEYRFFSADKREWKDFHNSISNHGETPVMLKELDLVDATDGLEITATYVNEPGSFGFVPGAGGPGAPLIQEDNPKTRDKLIRGDFHDLTGQWIAPESWYGGEGAGEFDLAVGFEVQRPGDYRFHGYSITYVDPDGTEHTDEFGINMRFCVGGRPRACTFPPDS